MQRRLVVLTFAFLLLTTAARFVASQNPTTASDVSSGIRTVTLATPRGDIKINLPGEVSAGDTISGTVVAEPKGKDDKEKKSNLDRLEGYVVEVANRRAKVSSGKIENIQIPDSAQTAQVILTDGQGKELARALIALGSLAALGANPNFSFPELGQSGRPYPISGPFDGNSSNTKINIDGTDAKMIAESPRGAVVDIPKTVVGPNNIVVNDNGKTSTGNFRAVKIDLTAPKTSLMRGESTELHVEVQGLQGITQPVQVQVQNQTPSNINLTGGNTQNIVIQPSQVTTGGTFNWNGTVTGTGTGGFNITGTIPTSVATTPSPSPVTSKPTPTPTPSPVPSLPPSSIPAVSPALSPSPSPKRTSPQVFPTPTDEERFNNSFTKEDTDCCKKLLNNGVVEVSDDKGNGFKINRNKLTMTIDGKEYEWEFTQDGKPFYIEWMFCHLNDHMIISQLSQVMIQRVKGGSSNEKGSTTSVSLHGPYRDEKSRRPSYGFQFGSQKIGTDTKEYGVSFSMDAETCAWSCQLMAEGEVREFRTDPARSTNAIFNGLNQSVGIPSGATAYQQQAWWNAMYSYFFEIEDWYLWLDGKESDDLRDTKENYNLWRAKLQAALGQMLNSAAPDDKKLIGEMLDLLKNTNPSPEDIKQIGQKFDSLHLRYGTKVPPEVRKQIMSQP
jgi:hypothetical protein